MPPSHPDESSLRQILGSTGSEIDLKMTVTVSRTPTLPSTSLQAVKSKITSPDPIASIEISSRCRAPP